MCPDLQLKPDQTDQRDYLQVVSTMGQEAIEGENLDLPRGHVVLGKLLNLSLF